MDCMETVANEHLWEYVRPSELLRLYITSLIKLSNQQFKTEGYQAASRTGTLYSM